MDVIPKSPVGLLLVLSAAVPFPTVAQSQDVPLRELTMIPQGEYAVVESIPEWSAGAAGEHPFEKISAIAMSDSTIAVADGQALMIHLFDQEGGYLTSLGREGEGPGEFRRISTVFKIPDDRFLAVDLWPSTRRLTAFELGEGLADPDPLRVNVSRVIGALPSGRLLGTRSPADLVGKRGVVEHQVVFYAFDPEGATDLLGHLPGMQVYLAESSNGIIVTLDLPFLAQAFVGVHPDGFVAANSRTGEVRVYSEAGSLKAGVRLQPKEVALSSADWRDYVQWYVSDLPEEYQPQERRLRLAVEPPSTWPSIAGILTDDRGNLWVKQFVPPHRENGQWLVFSSDLQFLGRVDVPSGFELRVVAAGRLLGVRKDAFDVEYVEAYALRPTRK